MTTYRNILVLVMMCYFIPVNSQGDPVAGKAIFKEKCTACHHMEMRLVGPALKDVHLRHDDEWLIRFIRSSQTVIETGDSTAIALFNQYNKVPMPDQELNDIQIQDLLTYFKIGDAPKEPGGITRPAVAAASNIRPMKFSDYRFWILYTITVILVIIAVYYKAESADLRKRLEQSGQ